MVKNNKNFVKKTFFYYWNNINFWLFWSKNQKKNVIFFSVILYGITQMQVSNQYIDGRYTIFEIFDNTYKEKLYFKRIFKTRRARPSTNFFVTIWKRILTWDMWQVTDNTWPVTRDMYKIHLHSFKVSILYLILGKNFLWLTDTYAPLQSQ